MCPNFIQSPEQKGENKDPCLICTSNLGKEVSVCVWKISEIKLSNSLPSLIQRYLVLA